MPTSAVGAGSSSAPPPPPATVTIRTDRIEEPKKDSSRTPPPSPPICARAPPPPPAVNTAAPSVSPSTDSASPKYANGPAQQLASGTVLALSAGIEERTGSTSTDSSVFSTEEKMTFLVTSEEDTFEVCVKIYHPEGKGILKRPNAESSDVESEEMPRTSGKLSKRVEFVEGLVTGSVDPEADFGETKREGHERSKSMDISGQDMGSLELRETDIEDAASIRENYKSRVRARGERKGRKFQQQTVQTYEDNNANAQETAFKEDTERMERDRDQLEIDVFALEQDIREKNRELEKKRKQLNDLQRQIQNRPNVWAKLLDPNCVLPVDAPPAEAAPEPPNESKEVLRYRVQKLGNYIFSKDVKRILELNLENKCFELYKSRKGDGEVIYAHQLHSCPQAPDKNSTVLNVKYYGDSDRRLLRALKDLKLKFDTAFLKERIFRVLRENFLPTPERRSSTFIYKPQPLPISEKTQMQVNALPVFKLASELHIAWMERKESMGWKFGSTQDEVAKTHPQMCDFERLSTEDQKYCLGIANLTLAGIFELGYSIKKAQGNQKSISPQLRPLIEFLAENAHESWADLKFKSGWRFDSKADSANKCHPELVPYCDLDDSAKEADREVVNVSVAFLIKSGYCVTRNTADTVDSPPAN